MKIWKEAYEIIEKFEKSPCVNLFSNEATKHLCLMNVCYGGVGGVTSEQLKKVFGNYEGWVGISLTHGKVPTIHYYLCLLLLFSWERTNKYVYI